MPARTLTAVPTKKETLIAALAVAIAAHRATGGEIALEARLEERGPREDIPETD